MLVNDLIHGLYPEAVTIGEDVSIGFICSILITVSFLGSSRFNECLSTQILGCSAENR
jgi:hypothetical protein